MQPTLIKPDLHIQILSPRRGIWAARGELGTHAGPIVLSVEIPEALVWEALKKVHDRLHSMGVPPATLAGEFGYADFGADDFGFGFGSIFNKVKQAASQAAHVATGAQSWAVKQVVNQAVNVAKATLPSKVSAIVEHVGNLAGHATNPAEIGRAFELSARAMTGDPAAKAQIAGLVRAATDNPLARAALAVVATTAKVLPNVKPLLSVAQSVPGLGSLVAPVTGGIDVASALARGDLAGAARAAANGASGGYLNTGLALAHGDWRGALASQNPAAAAALQMATGGNPMAALATYRPDLAALGGFPR